MNWMGGPVSFSPWILTANHVSYDGAVLVPTTVAGGYTGPGTINTNAIFIQGILFNPNAYLPLTGGTLSGNLNITSSIYASLTLNKNAPANYSSFIGDHNNVHRWFLNIGDSAVETGTGNAGSDFSLNNYSDAGLLLGTPLTIHRSDGSSVFNGNMTVNGNITPSLLTITALNQFYLGGGLPGEFLTTNGSGLLTWVPPPSGGGGEGTGDYLPTEGGILTGDLAISETGSVNFILNKGASGSINSIWGKMNEYNRWEIELGGAESESGSNNGSNLNIKNYTDAGSNISTALSINRKTGVTNISNLLIPNITNLSIGGGVSGAVPQTDGMGNLTWVPASAVGLPEAPTDGAAYGRSSALWKPVLALSGGTVLGSITVNNNITCQGTIFPNTLTMNNNNQINFFDASGGSASSFVLASNNNFVFSLTNASGTAQTIFTCPAHNSAQVFTFSVPVALPADPTLPLQAATKQYVDGRFGDIDAGGY
jgi:hypothetical protein